jgi:hypothetical protein
VQFEVTSVLIATPVREGEVKESRRYRKSLTGHCELVSTTRGTVSGTGCKDLSDLNDAVASVRLKALEEFSAIDQELGLGYVE